KSKLNRPAGLRLSFEDNRSHRKKLSSSETDPCPDEPSSGKISTLVVIRFGSIVVSIRVA
ncbi:hypothetical protein L0F63_006547, partial [Massospora cicadina]